VSPGDLRNEEGVLEWLVDDDTRELADEIEAVNIRMLDKLVEDSPFLAVFFCKFPFQQIPYTQIGPSQKTQLCT
jgi:hypothetical protein